MQRDAKLICHCHRRLRRHLAASIREMGTTGLSPGSNVAPDLETISVAWQQKHRVCPHLRLIFYPPPPPQAHSVVSVPSLFLCSFSLSSQTSREQREGKSGRGRARTGRKMKRIKREAASRRDVEGGNAIFRQYEGKERTFPVLLEAEKPTRK